MGIGLGIVLFSIHTSIAVRFIFFILAWSPLVINREANKYYVPSVFLYSLVINDNLMENVTFLPSSNSYLFYLLALTLILVINVRVYKNGAFVGNKYFIFVFLCFFLTSVDLMFTGEIGRYALLFMYTLLIYPFLNNRKSILYVLLTYILIAITLSSLLIVFKDQFVQSFSDIDRYSWVDPNFFASTIGIGFVISLFISFKYAPLKDVQFNKYLLLMIQALSLVAIALSGSRGAVVGIGVVLLLILMFSRIKLYYKLFFILILIAILWITYRLGYLDIILFRFLADESLSTGSLRTVIWGDILKGFLNSPFYAQLLGSGFEHSIVLSGEKIAHNEFVEFLADYGYIGLGLFIYLLITCFSKTDMVKSLSNLLLLYFILTAMTINPIRTVAFTILLVVIFKMRHMPEETYEQ